MGYDPEIAMPDSLFSLYPNPDDLPALELEDLGGAILEVWTCIGKVESSPMS